MAVWTRVDSSGADRCQTLTAAEKPRGLLRLHNATIVQQNAFFPDMQEGIYLFNSSVSGPEYSVEIIGW